MVGYDNICTNVWNLKTLFETVRFMGYGDRYEVRYFENRLYVVRDKKTRAYFFEEAGSSEQAVRRVIARNGE